MNLRTRGDADATVLMIEDDHAERQAIGRAVVRAGCSFSVTYAGNGEEALLILGGKGKDGPLPRAHIVVLDLNLPGMSGLEFLAELRKLDESRRSLVFVYSGSQDREEVRRAYDLGITGFFSKEMGSENYTAFVRMLGSYLDLVVFPA